MAGGEAGLLLHVFHRGVTDLYAFYNMALPKPLPPPPRPSYTKAFHYACALILAEMESGEDAKRLPAELRRQKYEGFVPPS